MANRFHGHGHGPVHTGEKASIKDSFGKLLKFSKKWRYMAVIGVLCAAVGAVCTLMGPGRLQRLTEVIEEGFVTNIDMSEVMQIGVFLIVLYSMSAIFGYVQNFMLITFTQRVSKKLRRDISVKINKVPLGYYNKTSYGDVLSRVTNDVDTISQTLNQSIGSLVTAITMFVGSLLLMFITNYAMAVAAVVSTIIGFIIMFLIMSKSQKYFVRQQNELGRLNGHIEEIYSGHNVVKVYNGERKAREKFDKINGALKTNAWKAQFLSGLMMPIMGFIGNLGYVAVCITGALLVHSGKIDFSVIVAFMIYVRLFTNPLSQIAQAATNMQSAAAASKRVFDFLGETEVSDESHKTRYLDPKTIKGDVEFEHVKFGYDPDKVIIHDFSMKAHAGQKIAIVGPTGAGKTTLVNLLMRFYELNEGRIIIDGVPIDELTRENVHDLFCMVLQDTWIFEGTIKENIIYSKENVSDEEVINACKAVGLDHFIRTLPKGYDTVLNDKVSLSAGQKQLVTIARAMVENAPLLILDEATSSVDTRTEQLVQQAMDKLTQGRTSFVIAHRLSTIKNADLILVLRDGDVVESGNHEELLKKGGFYATLYNSQFEDSVA